MAEYNHKEIEKKWQKRWAEAGLYKTEDQVSEKENYYLLVELPYPSGDLHVGHWYAFSVPDIFARFKRMHGYNVLYPIGFDAFGLPAENTAIKHNINPREWTENNIQTMRTQLEAMGNMFDWSRELATCTPEYYKWNQWIFNKFFEKGLVYRKKVPVNWDPVDQTVLANEQVLPDGTAERSGAKVEKKDLEQWMFKITDYAERLLTNLDSLDWPESIKELQKNWIGKSEGLIFSSPVKDSDLVLETFSAHFEAFYADTFVVIAPDHPQLPELVAGLPDEQEVLEEAKKMVERRDVAGYEADKEISGIFTGRYTIDPVGNGELPIWIASYALADYGTGIVKCSAHDERDFAFAKKYNLKLKPVLFPKDPDVRKQVENLEICFSDMQNGILSEPSEFSGKVAGDNREAIADYAEKKGLAKRKTTYKMRDWSISRQRYWGTPIPIVYDPEGSAHSIPDEHLPWLLPTDVDYKPKGTSPLGSSKELLERTEKIFGKGWKPEIDTLDTFMDSSWYFLRYFDSKNEKEFSSKEVQKKWMPINTYFGGAEHTTVHLLYSRFFQMALYDLDLATTEEPYMRRFNRGLIMNEDGSKMSKRAGAVNPDEQVDFVGSDAVKMYLAFMGPYGVTDNYPWNSGGVVGIRRFLEKVHGLSLKVSDSPTEALESPLHQAIKKITGDIELFKFNTAISQMMIFTNAAEKEGAIGKEQYQTFLKLLAPFAPHLSEELWEKLGHSTSVHLEEWPQYDEKKAASEKVMLAVQINGKARGAVEVSRGAEEKEVLVAAQNDEKLAKYLDFEPKKVIFVPDRIINLIQ